MTFNSTTIRLPKNDDMKASTYSMLKSSTNSVNNEVEYTVSFNCMRQPLEIPMTYTPECRLGVYDLA